MYGRRRIKHRLDEPSRAVAVDSGNEVDSLRTELRHQGIHRDVLDIHVQRQRKGNEISYRFGVKGRVQGGQQTAETVTEQRDALDLFANLHRSHGIGQVTVDVGIKSSPAIGTRGRHPVNEIDFEALLREGLDQTPSALQVENERSFNQRVNDQQRRRLRLAYRLIVA